MYPVVGSLSETISSQLKPAGLAVDANNIYWTTLGAIDAGGTVMAAPISGAGSPRALASGQALPFGIATDLNGNRVTGRTWGRRLRTAMAR